MKGLSEFTIDILKFADLIKDSAVLTVPGGPRVHSPRVGGERLVAVPTGPC